MTTQEYITKIEESDLDPKLKTTLITLLEKDGLTIETRENISGLLQKEIDDFFASENIVLNPDEMHEANTKLDRDLAQIESDLKEDMAFIEEEMSNLETVVKKLDKAAEDAQIDALKEEIAA